MNKTEEDPARRSATESPEISVLIVSYNSARDILACLLSLEKSTHQRFRVVICENAGDSAFSELQDLLPSRLCGGQSVELHRAPNNLGFAGGVNFCLDRAGQADAFWILNPDTEPGETALAEMISRLGQGDCGAVGHDLVLPSGRLASRGGGRWRAATAQAISIDHGHSREPRPPPAEVEARMNYIIGASMLVSPRFLEAAGRMRDDYFLYCEEVEWCLRAQAAGQRIGYAAEALVLHAHGTSTGGGGALKQRSRISTYLVERNRLLLTRDLFSDMLPFAAAFALAHLIFKFARARAWAQLGHACSGWWAGVRNERGAPAWFPTT